MFKRTNKRPRKRLTDKTSRDYKRNKGRPDTRWREEIGKFAGKDWQRLAEIGRDWQRLAEIGRDWQRLVRHHDS